METNPISAIQPLWEGSLFGAQENDGAQGRDLSFLGIFQGAIDNVKEADDEKSKAEYLLATGQLDDPSTMMTVLSKYQLSVDMLVQLRNKALDAYSELTRMSL